jgi:hypothetical protein
LDVLRKIDGQFERVGLEADPLSQWLFFALRGAGLPAICVETRHMKVAMPAMATRTTAMMRVRSLKSFARANSSIQAGARQVDRESEAAHAADDPWFPGEQDPRPRKEMRGALRPYGLKVGRVSSSTFAARIRELVADRPRIAPCMEAPFRSRERLIAELHDLHWRCCVS